MDLLEEGKILVKSKIKNIPSSPGIYKFLDNKSKIIYIGKAKNLPKRLLNYTSSSGLTIRIQRLIASIKEYMGPIKASENHLPSNSLLISISLLGFVELLEVKEILSLKFLPSPIIELILPEQVPLSPSISNPATHLLDSRFES